MSSGGRSVGRCSSLVGSRRCLTEVLAAVMAAGKHLFAPSVAYAILRRVNEFTAWMRSMPMLVRWVVIGAISAGVTGGLVGLVVGLFVYAPTAPFGAVELGFPATLTGGIGGLVAGLIMITIRRIRSHGANSL